MKNKNVYDNRLLEAFRMFKDEEVIILYDVLIKKSFCKTSEDLLNNLYKIKQEREL
jgi:hypothetical protein